MNITQVPTPDFTAGHKSYDYVVMHWSVTTNLAQVDSEVLNPNRQMSYHYAIDKNEVHQYVDTKNTAWHAGVFDVNQRSIGVCIVAGPSYPYTDQDYETAAQLIADLFRKHGRMEIKGHRDFKATECPGNLDFGRLRARVDEILTGGLVMDKDAIQFEGNERIYFWAQNPDVAKSWYGNDWSKYVRVIKPQVVEKPVYIDKPYPVETIKEVIKYIDKIEYKDSPETLNQVAELRAMIESLTLTEEQKTILDIWSKIKSLFKKG